MDNRRFTNQLLLLLLLLYCVRLQCCGCSLKGIIKQELIFHIWFIKLQICRSTSVSHQIMKGKFEAPWLW